MRAWKSVVFVFIRRMPFTLLTASGLAMAALLTNTYVERITQPWMEMAGFAPNDLWLLRLERLFTSALVTSGGWVFWQAIFFICAAVGLAEWLTTTRRTAMTFWGIHLLTLILLSIIVSFMLSPLRNLGLEASEVARDVGPSAGYFACLGLVSAKLKRPWHWISGISLLLVFLTVLFLPPQIGEDARIKFSADFAHLMAFPLGWASSLIEFKR